VNLNQLANNFHEVAVSKGFWDGEYNYDKVGNKLALVHSEVTEVLEAIRKNQGSEKVVEEMADVIIRLLDLYAAMQEHGDVTHDIDLIIENKNNINKQRAKLHGNKF
jgi:NTP pyrophosphatase (non-canonical NTP hydrolase)